MEAEKAFALAPGSAECLPALRGDETLMEYIGWIVLAIYDLERARLGSHSAVASRLGIHLNTLTDWLARTRRITKKVSKV